MNPPAIFRTAASPWVRVMLALAAALVVAAALQVDRAGAQEVSDPVADEAAYTREFVRKAIDMYGRDGFDATVEHYNSEASLYGQWYVFIYDGRDVLIAHAAAPDLIGTRARAIFGPNGYPAGKAVVTVARNNPDGAWLTYPFTNPATGYIETKHSWVQMHDGLIFGSGWHEVGPSRALLPEFTREFVERSVNLYDSLGLEDTVEYYNTRESTDGQWYIFIADSDGVIIAHPTVPANLGQSLLGDIGVDETGYPFGLDLLSATGSGKWVNYRFLNPASGEVELKHTWVVLHDGLFFASGWYGAAPQIIGLPATGGPALPTGLAMAAGLGGILAIVSGAAVLAFTSRYRARRGGRGQF